MLHGDALSAGSENEARSPNPDYMQIKRKSSPWSNVSPAVRTSSDSAHRENLLILSGLSVASSGAFEIDIFNVQIEYFASIDNTLTHIC